MSKKKRKHRELEEEKVESESTNATDLKTEEPTHEESLEEQQYQPVEEEKPEEADNDAQPDSVEEGKLAEGDNQQQQQQQTYNNYPNKYHNNKQQHNNNNKKFKPAYQRINFDPRKQYYQPEERESWGPNVKGKKFRKEKGKKKRCPNANVRIDGSVKSIRLDA